MAEHSIDDVNYDEATSKVVVDETVQGQPQAKPRDLDDGKVTVRETAIKLDTVILDPNHPLAVQVPEGIGADTTGDPNPLADAFAAGTAEDQFAAGSKSTPAPAKADAKKDA